MGKEISYLKSILAHWEKSVIDYIPNIFLSIIVMLLFFIIAKIAKKYIFKIYSTATAKTNNNYIEIAYIFSIVIYGFFIISGVFIALQILGLEKVLTKLLAGAGVLGIIAGFAFKDVASNLFAGLLLKVQQPFGKDDWVEIDNTYGKVIELGWITTTIKTVPGQQVFVPNQLIYNNTFTSYTAFHKRRVIFESGVSYGDDLELVKRAALEEARLVESVLPDEPIDFYFTEIGSSTYNFQLRFWIHFENNVDYKQASSDIIMRIKKRFEKEDICIAYTVTTLDFGVKGGVNVFDKPLQIELDSDNSIDVTAKDVVTPMQINEKMVDSVDIPQKPVTVKKE
ncbi:mechanosensitive ion channel family protein [Psychrobacter sp. I-STPA6b]|uniref:mechanosensitive ion channel family protein n=1 Tax=Psychrobacter sp. I-STPA6b TaxID=2585718 RepID=UPI001D0C538C|nr:mechanosensitive ion channel [Psychrobacter sp. I-STPA6b]